MSLQRGKMGSHSREARGGRVTRERLWRPRDEIRGNVKRKWATFQPNFIWGRNEIFFKIFKIIS